MLTIRSSSHVRTRRHIKGLRSCVTTTGLPIFKSETGRLLQETLDLRTREIRRQWLCSRWKAHVRQCTAAG